MPVPNQLISPSTLRRMRLGYNRSLPELVNVFRLASHKQLGPYLGRMVAGTGDEAVYADALAGRQGWTVYLCYQMAWAPLTAFGEGTAVLALRPTSATMDKAFICTTGGTTGATEPNWLGSSPITDGTCIWQAAPSFNTGCDLLKVDKLQIAGHTLDILDMPSGATWQVYYQAVCAERT